MPDTNIYDNVV